MVPEKKERGVTVKLILAITRGLILDRHTRRMTMFLVVLAALFMLLVGTVFLNSPTRDGVLLFVAFWGICAFLTFLAMLLAVYDLLMVRLTARRERQRLKTEIFGSDDDR